MWGLIVIQWLHVLLGMFWFGSLLYLDVVVIPAVMTLPLEQQRTVSKPLTIFSDRVLIPAAILVILLGLVRGTIFGPVKTWTFLLGTAYGLTFLLALLAALATLACGLLVLNRAARRLDTFPLAEVMRIRWNRGTRLRLPGAAGQALCPARAVRFFHHLHLYDPDALWPLRAIHQGQPEGIMSRQTFLATTGHGLARASQHASGEWQVECLLAGQDVRCLTAHRTNPDVVYAGTQGNGVLRSNDGGRTWSAAGLQGQVVKALATSPMFPNTVYAGTKPARLFVSHDAGAQWAELASFRHIPGRWLWFSPAEKPYRAYVQAIALSPTDPQTILVGMEAGAVVSSRDGGQTWTGHRRGALRDCHSLTFHATHGDWVYEGGGTGAGVSISRDAGATWAQPKEGLDRHYGWAVAADPAQPDVWYASVAPGALKAHSEHQAHAAIVRSMGGTGWQPLSGGLPQPLNSMPYALLTDPSAPGQVYAGLSNGEVWHSTDYGDTWHQLPFCLGSIRRTLLALP